MNEGKVYIAEFKREAVRLSERAGMSAAQIAELGVSDYSLYKWRTTGTSFGRRQAKESGELAFPGDGKVALTAEALKDFLRSQQENVRLKRELERAKRS